MPTQEAGKNLPKKKLKVCRLMSDQAQVYDIVKFLIWHSVCTPTFMKGRLL